MTIVRGNNEEIFQLVGVLGDKPLKLSEKSQNKKKERKKKLKLKHVVVSGYNTNIQMARHIS